MNLILASASPRRQEILRALGFTFRVYPARVAEIGADFFSGRVPLTNAIIKAEAVADSFPDDVVLGADTVIECDEEIIGKPVDLNDARAILNKLSGRNHAVVTGVAIYCRKTRLRCVFAASTTVTFRQLDQTTINEYLRRVHVLDKAGAYAIQEHGEMIVERIDGALDNVVGLPGEPVKAALQLAGIVPGKNR